MMEATTIIPVTDASVVGEARRAATALAHRHGLDATTTGEAALLAVELTQNIARHAQDGLICLRALQRGEQSGVEILALDRGPGISDVARALRDGYSTAGTAGKGLGAVQRIATAFDIYSQVNGGTVVLAQVWDKSAVRATRQMDFEVGAISRPKEGESVCGDAWYVNVTSRRAVVMVVDGLGHGFGAMTAAHEAESIVAEERQRSPLHILTACHAGLRATRGVAMAVAELHYGGHEMRYSSVGNIAGEVSHPGGSRGLAGQNGIVGHQMRKVSEFVQAWSNDSVLLLHSDGLSSRVHLDRYAGLATRHPSVIAGVMFRDFERGRDDATIVCVRQVPS